ITASSISGALAQWRRRLLDLKMGAVMASGGLGGTVFGVWLFTLMRRYGQMDLLVSSSYVILLGTIGGLMLNESLGAVRARQGGRRICGCTACPSRCGSASPASISASFRRS